MRRGDPVAGTHNHGLWLWVPALRPLHGRRSGRRSFIRTRNQPAAVGNDRWFPSPVSGLLFTGKIATQTCEASARLFSRPGFGAGEGCCYADHATFELQCRLNPGPGHFQQDLAVPFRLGIAGPTQTLLRELTEVFGRCWHGALRTENRGGARPVSQPPAPGSLLPRLYFDRPPTIWTNADATSFLETPPLAGSVVSVS